MGGAARAGRTSSFMHLLLHAIFPSVWALKPPSWAFVHKTTYAPMIYTALCIMFWTWASGRGLTLEISSFQGPKWHSPIGSGTGPKKVLISRTQPSPICPRNGLCPHQKHYARGRINQRCINSYKLFYNHSSIAMKTVQCPRGVIFCE
jgi:hypothetical protein